MQESMHDMSWPPAYRLKKHKRARHVKISTSRKHGLEITVPHRFSLKNIPSILEENKDWVMKQLVCFHARQSADLPQHIAINSINEIWNIHYLETKGKLKILQRAEKEIVLIGAVKNKELCKEKLLLWLKEQAKVHLNNMLLAISQKVQLPYKKAMIRDQATRWGSCTSDKSISLNFKLLFLPFNLVTHIIIHELCHTVFLNHSKKFWDLVEKHDPAWKENKLAMKQADKYIPAWL